MGHAALVLALVGGIALPAGSASDCNQNGVGDAVEIATAVHKDTNHNGLLDVCEGLSVNLDHLSLSQGGTQALQLELGPAAAGSIYWMIGSLAGEAPGLTVGFAHLPLNWDGVGAYMAHTLTKANTGLLKKGFGVLDASGRATAQFALPAGFDPGLAGLTVRHAYMLLGPDYQTFVWASNAVALRLDP